MGQNKQKTDEIKKEEKNLEEDNQETINSQKPEDIQNETSKNEETDKHLSEKDQKIEELTNLLKRVQADFENYKKRAEKDNARIIDCSKADIIKKMLPLLDSFEIAIKNSSDEKTFKDGMKMILKEFQTVLKNQGVEKINCESETFDSNLHDAMMAVEAEGIEKDTILDVLQTGYKLNNKVIRHAKVKLAK